jgi:hypothetical protein
VIERNPVEWYVRGFVVKSGGIEQIEAAVESMSAMKLQADLEGNDNEYVRFMKRLSKRPEGARQMVAAAMLGFTLAALMFRAGEQMAERN